MQGEGTKKCPLREHVKKKFAFLAGHSAKALTPPPVSGTKVILGKFFLHIDIHIYVFEISKPDMEKSF